MAPGDGQANALADLRDPVRVARLHPRDPDVVQAQDGEVHALRRSREAAGPAQHRPGLLGLVGQGEDRALVERGLRQRRLVARGLEDPHRALSAVLGRVGLPGHEPMARHAHEA
jgi:hypothetical protein